jgi:carboxymethylenebutenolidase
MCFGSDSRPPIPPLAGAAVDGRQVELSAADGARFAAYAADATYAADAADTGQPSGAGVVVLPDVRGLHPYYEELALRFAEAGVDAIAIDYFGRSAGVSKRGDDFEYMPHVQQTHYETLMLDVATALADMRARRRVRAIFSVGFCFGGRLAFLTATRSDLALSGAVGFYGGPVGPGRAGMPAPAEVADQFGCPILGLFGGADQGIPAENVAEFEQALSAAGVEHDLVTYDAAPHGFFDRKADQYADASADAWRRVLEFVRRLTPPG